MPPQAWIRSAVWRCPWSKLFEINPVFVVAPLTSSLHFFSTLPDLYICPFALTLFYPHWMLFNSGDTWDFWLLNACSSQLGWWDVEKSFCSIIRRFDLHHIARACFWYLRSCRMMNLRCTRHKKGDGPCQLAARSTLPKPCYFLHYCSFDVSLLSQNKERRRTVIILTYLVHTVWLVIFGLGAEMWKKASVKISDTLIHITAPLLKALGVLGWDEEEKPQNTTYFNYSKATFPHSKQRW